jgi:NO-binding membrane sensor protein with MHYT domain
MRWIKQHWLAVLTTFVITTLALPVVVHAQEGSAPPGDILYLVGLVVAGVLPFATSFVYEGIQRVATGLASLPTLAKVIGGIVIGYGLTWVAYWLGVELPGSLADMTEKNVVAILEGLAAVGMHYLRNKRNKPPALA